MPKINPQILTWARESAGLSLEDAARAIGLSGANSAARLAELEAGERDPSRRQLVEMARKYRRPLLTFYLPKPPAPGQQTHDFRTLPDREPGSEALLSALVRDVKARQALIRSALEDAEEDEPLRFVGSVRAEQGAAALATAMKQILRFDLLEYRRTRNIDEAFRLLRDAVERAGVFVILKGNLGHHTSNISPNVFRGLALADPVAPFIIINETDSRSAWSFTLLHELGHILLGQSVISGYDSAQELERLCDDAAARFLLRPRDLNWFRNNMPIDQLAETIGDFSINMKVSRKMVAYNLLRSGIIPRGIYSQLAEHFDAERLEAAARGRNGGPVDYYVVRRHRVGAKLINVVGRMVAGGALTATKAGKVLGVQPTAVGRMTEGVRAVCSISSMPTP